MLLANNPVQAYPQKRITSASPVRAGLLALFVMFLQACKIVIIVPEDGKVTSINGEECLSGQTCVIEVTTTDFEDTFTGVPNSGYVFKRWNFKESYFCGNRTNACRLFTSAFVGIQPLLGILASDKDFYLEPVFVTKTDPYDVGYWAQVIDEIDNASFTTDDYLYKIQPIVAQCDPGLLNKSPRKRALAATNQVRDLHNLPPVKLDETFTMEAQEASLVQKANSYLTHFPAPADACYSASAEEGSGTSNLHSGPQGDPASHVFGWTNDNNNLAALDEAGHRRWMLHPDLGYVAYGQVEGPSALKVFGFNKEPAVEASASLEFVAFPYKTYPYILVSKGDSPTPWSLSMVPLPGASSQFDHFSTATVEVKDTASGTPVVVHSLHDDTLGFGLANFLSWMVDDWEHDTEYTVTVRNVRMPGGNVQDIEYPVTIDRFNLLDLEEPLEVGDSQQGTTLSGNFDTALDKDSYTVPLSGSVDVSGESIFSSQAFFILIYDDKKDLVASSDVAFTMVFPAGDYTVVASPCNESGVCYQGVPSYTVEFQ